MQLQKESTRLLWYWWPGSFQKKEISTKALAELYNSGGHYGRARELLVAALNSGKNSKQLEGQDSKVDPKLVNKVLAHESGACW